MINTYYVDLADCRPQLEDSEDVEVILADKAMVRQILSEGMVSLRGAYLMMQFFKWKKNRSGF